MAYKLHLDESAVKAYLRNHPSLTRGDRVKLFAALHADLASNADSYRATEERRLAPASDYFRYDIVFRDSEDRIRQFWFAVSDRAAAFGVLLVDYVEESVGR